MACSSVTKNYIEILVNGKHARAMVDTGAHYSCVNADFARRHKLLISSTPSSLPKLMAADGKPLSVVGKTEVPVSIAGYVCYIEFIVIEALHHTVIFGLDALRDNNIVIDVANSSLSVANNLFTVPLLHRFASRQILRTINSITVQPYHEVRLPVRIAAQYKLCPSIIEPLLTAQRTPITVAKVYVEPKEHVTVCQLVNLSDKPVTVCARRAIATISPADIMSNDSDDVSDAYTSGVSDIHEDNLPHEEKLTTLRKIGFKLTLGDLNQTQFEELVDILYEYREVFATEVTQLPGVRDVEYEIKLKHGTKPKRQRQFRYPPHLREVIRKQLEEWEKAGIVAEGDPLWIHPIVLVRKRPPDGRNDTPPAYRVCLDLREINKVMEIESYPMPTFNSVVESFGDPPPKIFTVMDCLSGFLQVPVTKESSRYLGLSSDNQCYVMRRVPFGMVTSPFIFQKFMNRLLSNYQFIFACAYIDDLLIFSSDWTAHSQHLRLILDRVLESGLRLRPDKCKFAQSELRYLGMILSDGRIKPDPEKLSVIAKAKPPANAKLLKSFLGMTSFYRRFIKGYAKICEPFRNLLKKNAPFVWTEKHTAAFEKLKEAMTTQPLCLHVPNWNQTFVLISDSSRHGSGYIIANEDEQGRHHPIIYGGRQWNKHEREWSVSELEMAGIVNALASHSQFFIHRHFKIITDHLSNTWVRNLKYSTGKLYRWSLQLQNYSFDIVHIKGDKMPADFISRVVEGADKDAPNLDDESALVFAADLDNTGDEQVPTFRRPRENHDGRRRTTVVNWPAGCSIRPQHGEICQSTDELTSRQSVRPVCSSRAGCMQYEANYFSPVTVNTSHSSKMDADFQSKTAGTANCMPLAELDSANTDVRTDSTDASTRTEDGLPQQRLTQLTELRPDADLARKQRDSPDLAEMIAYLEHGTLPPDDKAARRLILDADNWTIGEDNILYHIHNPRRRNVNAVKPIIKQIAVPQSLRHKVLVAMHDQNSHFRLDKTYQTIQNHFYWRGLYTDVDKHLQKCTQCSLASQKPPPRAMLKHAPLLGVFEKLVVDHISMPTSTWTLTGQQVSYVLTLVDQASQWTILVPLKDCTAKSTALAIQFFWISQYGTPSQIHCDLGPAFTSNLMKELCTLYNIEHTFASSQNHKSVTRAENTHRIILSALRKICDKRKDGQDNKETLDWPDRLPGVLLSLHASVVTTIGLSPAYMTYHRELRLPWLADFPLNVQSQDRMLTDLLDTVRVTDNLIRENTLQSFAQADRQYNKNAKPRKYEEGDKALLYSEYVPAGEMRKMHIFYRPIKIEACLPHECYKVRDLNTDRVLPAKIYVDRLKPFVGSHAVTDLSHVTDNADMVQSHRATGDKPTPANKQPQASEAIQPPQRRSAQRHGSIMPTQQRSDWHRITRIRRRRRTANGSYLYEVEWETDNSTSWLSARDISPHVVRQFNASKHRRRR